MGRNPKNPQLDLKEMATLYHVARLGSVTKAARYLGIGQTTASRRLQTLAEHFKAEVFERADGWLIHRMKMPPTLTVKGAELLELITPIVEGATSLQKNMKRRKRNATFAIGACPELVSDRWSSLIQNFRSRHPKVRLRIASSSHPAMIQQMKCGELDVVIGIGQQDDDLVFEKVSDFRVVLLIPRGHALAHNPFPKIEDIAEWPIVFSGAGTAVRSWAENLFKEKRLDLQIAVEVEGADIAKELVEIGTGVAFCADFTVSELDRKKFDVIPLDHLIDGLTIGLWTLKCKEMNRSTAKLVTTLWRNLSDVIPTDRPAEWSAVSDSEYLGGPHH